MQAHILSENYHSLFGVFLPPVLYWCLRQFGSKFCFLVAEGWDDFWLQDYGLNSPNFSAIRAPPLQPLVPKPCRIFQVCASAETPAQIVLWYWDCRGCPTAMYQHPCSQKRSFPFPPQAGVECLCQHTSHPGREAEKELSFHCSV